MSGNQAGPYSIFVILRSPLVWPGGATTLAFLDLRSPRTFQGGLGDLKILSTKILVLVFANQDLVPLYADLGAKILVSLKVA